MKGWIRVSNIDRTKKAPAEALVLGSTIWNVPMLAGDIRIRHLKTRTEVWVREGPVQANTLVGITVAY